MPPGKEEETVELVTLGVWPASAMQKLRDSWITTAEQVVAIGSTAEGTTVLAKQTGLREDEVRRLLDLTKSKLPEDVRRRAETPADTSKYGLGAIDPDSRKDH